MNKPKAKMDEMGMFVVFLSEPYPKSMLSSIWVSFALCGAFV